jgi:hypothetical protein
MFIHHLWSCPFINADNEPDTLNIDDERKQIEKAILDSGLSIKFRSAVATNKELQLEASDCTIAHLSMHGDIGFLGLEYSPTTFSKKIGSVDSYSVIDVQKLNPQFKPKLVSISACHSESIGNAFVSIGVHHVIAIKR